MNAQDSEQLPKINVFVIATMSAGKTSLINALLGSELLWSANEAATATITRIYHDHCGEYDMHGSCFTWNGECHQVVKTVDSVLLREWNAHCDIKHIELHGRIASFCDSPYTPIIHDTPGANNSQDPTHVQLFKEALETYRTGIIVYVLNATQLATRDDANLLKEIKNHLDVTPDKTIVFVLNKVDALDEDKGEVLSHTVNSVTRYLKKFGFFTPVIIPAMMCAALIAKKSLTHLSITRSQKNHLRNELMRFRLNKHVINNAAVIPRKLHATLAQELKCNTVLSENDHAFCDHELRQFIAYSGLRTLELYLTHYLD